MSRLFPVATNTLTTDDWYTPPYIIEAIGLTYKLDPCAPSGGVPWIPAEHHYTIDDDGLAQPWRGRVWLNPPYSKPGPWLRKLAAHGNGVALIAADTATSTWHDTVTTASGFLFIRGRVHFVRPDMDGTTRSRFPSVVAVWGEDNLEQVRDSKLGWWVSG